MRSRLAAFSFLIACCLIAVALTVASTPSAAAPPPPGEAGPIESPCLPSSHCPDSYPIPGEHLAIALPTEVDITASRLAEAAVSPQATIGPDGYGYVATASDSNWDELAGLTDTEMSGSSAGQRFGPVPLGFDFKFYEETYSTVYIAASGYLSFVKPDSWPAQSRMPWDEAPNAIVAPYWAPTYLSSGQTPSGRVYFTNVVSAPVPYFAAVWDDVLGGPPGDATGANESFTFMAKLFRDGRIEFQYGAMNFSSDNQYYCGTAGIEDSNGWDGLVYSDFCLRPPSNRTVTYTPPAPGARVSLYPPVQRQFGRPNETDHFPVTIRNTGDRGDDTYAIVATGVPDPVRVEDSAGATITNTGPLAPGAAYPAFVELTVPLGGVGDSNAVSVTVASSLEPTRTATAQMQAAVPAPFAQAFTSSADGAMSLYLAQPGGQTVTKVTGNQRWGSQVALAATPANGFVYAWTRMRSAGSVSVNEIEYALINRYGDVTRSASRLHDNSGATHVTRDLHPAVAVAPNGRIGIAWQRYVWNQAANTYNYNIMFRVLDANGAPVSGTLNVTNNALWGKVDPAAAGVPWFYPPTIAATNDGRFVIAWKRQVVDGRGGWNDIYVAIVDSGGAVKAGPAPIVETVDPKVGFDRPGLTRLSIGPPGTSRVYLTFDQWEWVVQGGEQNYVPKDVWGMILDSSGQIVKIGGNDAANLTQAVADAPTGTDAAQLSDGRIVVAWTSGSSSAQRVSYTTVLSTGVQLFGPVHLNAPDGATAGDYVSVSATQDGKAVITWTEADWYRTTRLYYALVRGDGTLLTSPMYFYTLDSSTGYLQTNGNGYGSASYGWSAPNGVDLVAGFGKPSYLAEPTSQVPIGITYANHGADLATSVVLTATLAEGMTYVSTTSGITPQVVGRDVVWHLPSLAFLAKGGFSMTVRVPEGSPGATWPITLKLTSAEADAKPSDNQSSTKVVIPYHTYVPLTLRNAP